MSFDLDAHISKTLDFPKEGILFYDFSPALEDGAVLSQLITAMCDIAKPFQPDIIAGIDARGFLFATPLALTMGCGAVMVRKAGKLPGDVIEQSYELEYGSATLSLQASRNIAGKRVLLVDDLLATGGTLSASVDLIRKAGGIVAGTVCLIELTGLKGKEKLGEKDCPVASLQQYEF